MRIITIAARTAAWLLSTAAKTVGGMHGVKPFADESAAALYRRRGDYRP
ncbi:MULTISPECIES: hypothetical protein [unclassified Curtobacterium]|nr:MULTISPECIES: hypothetical protein [unclassified Curtobacterium]WIB64684.1 hypothetical protein DEI94_05705 [Curtobacterium sp. MCBD17_040]